MRSGDVCVGYDLKETQFVNDDAENERSTGKLPDVVVIRKLYGGVAAGEADAAKKRVWRLQRLDVEVAETTKSSRAAKIDAEADDMDEEDFLREVEADKEMRSQMNLYKSEQLKKQKSAEDAMKEEDADDTKKATQTKARHETNTDDDDDDEEDDQEVKLDELLDGLVLDEGPDQEDQPGDNLDDDGEFFGLEEGEKAAKDGIKYVGREAARQVKAKEGAVPASSFGAQYDVKDFKFL
jgi:nonsense-mediated mRNA decay protein 3